MAALILERETGVEPATLSLGKRPRLIAPTCIKSQSFANPRHSRSEDLHSVSPLARFRSPFAAPVLQGFLTVRDVAAQLAVSTATVYKLCAARELAYLRVLGAIRIAIADLASYLAREKSGRY